MIPASPAQLAACLSVVQPLITTITPQQWRNPTPCADWDVHALVTHVVSGNQLFADILTGRTTLEEFRGQPPRDVLGDRPSAAFQGSAEAVVAAFELPGTLDRPVTVPFGTVPGMVALHLRITEILVHGWDLARALGQSVNFDDAVAAQELRFSRQALTQLPPERTPFAAPTPVPPTATTIDQLVALLGRNLTTTG